MPGRLETAPGRRDRLHGRLREDAVAVDEDGQVRIGQAEPLEELVGLGRVRLVPLVRLRGAGQEVAEAVVLRVHPPPDDLHR